MAANGEGFQDNVLTVARPVRSSQLPCTVGWTTEARAGVRRKRRVQWNPMQQLTSWQNVTRTEQSESHTFLRRASQNSGTKHRGVGGPGAAGKTAQNKPPLSDQADSRGEGVPESILGLKV